MAKAAALIKRFVKWAFRQAAICLALIAVFISAVMTYSYFARPAERDLPQIIEKLKTGSEAERIMLLHDLGRLGPNAADAVPVLIENLSHSSKAVAISAASVLARIGPPAAEAVPKLKETLRDRNRFLRINAAAAIWAITRDGTDVVPMLAKLAKAKDGRVQMHARFVLSEIDTPEARAALQ